MPQPTAEAPTETYAQRVYKLAISMPKAIDSQRLTEILFAEQKRRAGRLAAASSTDVEGGIEGRTAFGGQAWEAVQSLPDTAISEDTVAAVVGDAARSAPGNEKSSTVWPGATT